MKKLKISSIGAATYVTMKTGIRGDVKLNHNTGTARVEFEETEETLKHFKDFQEALFKSKVDELDKVENEELRFIMEQNKLFLGYRAECHKITNEYRNKSHNKKGFLSKLFS